MPFVYLLTDFQNNFGTFYDTFDIQYYSDNILPRSNETINYPRKFILKYQNQDVNRKTHEITTAKNIFFSVVGILNYLMGENGVR